MFFYLWKTLEDSKTTNALNFNIINIIWLPLYIPQRPGFLSPNGCRGGICTGAFTSSAQEVNLWALPVWQRSKRLSRGHCKQEIMTIYSSTIAQGMSPEWHRAWGREQQWLEMPLVNKNTQASVPNQRPNVHYLEVGGKGLSSPSTSRSQEERGKGEDNRSSRGVSWCK